MPTEEAPEHPPYCRTHCAATRRYRCRQSSYKMRDSTDATDTTTVASTVPDAPVVTVTHGPIGTTNGRLHCGNVERVFQPVDPWTSASAEAGGVFWHSFVPVC